MQFDYEVVHNSGKSIPHVDGLSRANFPSGTDSNNSERGVSSQKGETVNSLTTTEQNESLSTIETLVDERRRDFDNIPFLNHIQDWTFPENRQLAREVLLTRNDYIINDDGVLVRIVKNGPRLTHA